MSDLLQQAMTAIQLGDTAQGRKLIDQVLEQEPNNETAWLMLSEAVEDVQQRRICLERVLNINPANADAQAALAKLVTSPLAPISRGERGNPPGEPQPESAPAFTPPFTWEGEPEQYGASEDNFFAPLPEPEPEQPSDLPQSFDWATDSEEPDEAMKDIFAAVSQPELASQPLPDTDLTWLLESKPDQELSEAIWGTDQPAPGEPEPIPQPEESLPPSASLPDTDMSAEPFPWQREEFAVDAQPHLGIAAFLPQEELPPPAPPVTPLWENPAARTSRLVMLSDKSLIYANPNPTDIPQISELFAQKKMQRNLLGAGAGAIKLETIQRMSADPNGADLTVTYLLGETRHSHRLQFASQPVRDEVLAAMRQKLSPEFIQTTQNTSLLCKILAPLLVLLVFAGGSLVFYFGLLGLSKIPAIQAGGNLALVQGILLGLTSPQGTAGILGIGGLFSLAALVWLVSSLRKPATQIIVERPPQPVIPSAPSV